MKFTLIFVLGSFQFGAAPEQAPRDPWLGKDKLYHFVGSAVIQSAGHSLGRAAGLNYREASWTAAGLTLSVGVGKELHDRADGRFFSWRDVAADVSGGGVGAVVVRQVDR